MSADTPRTIEPTPNPTQEQDGDRANVVQRAANYFVSKAVKADLGESPKMLLGEHSLKEGRELPVIPATAKPRHHRIPKVDLIIEDVAPNREEAQESSPIRRNNHSWPWGGASKHNALLRVVPDAKHHHKFAARKSAEKLVDRLASADHKHDNLLKSEIMYGQRTIYGRITNLPVMPDGTLGELQPRHTAEKWVDALNPHNILRFKEMYIDKMTARAKGTWKEGRDDIPKAHMHSGNLLILDPATVAAYFNVEIEDWVNQTRGEGEAVPSNVVTAMGHYLSISDENLESTCEAIQSPRNSEMVDAASAAPEYKQPEVINPHDEINMEDVVYVHKFVDEEIRKELKKENPQGGMMPRLDFQTLSHRVRRQVVEDYLGPNATQEEIEKLTKAVGRYNGQKRR